MASLKLSVICRMAVCLLVFHAVTAHVDDVKNLQKQVDSMKMEGAKFKNATKTMLQRLAQKQDALYNMAPLITSTINNLVADTQKNRMSLKVVTGKQNRLFAIAPLIQGQISGIKNATIANKKEQLAMKREMKAIRALTDGIEKMMTSQLNTLGQLAKDVEEVKKAHQSN